MNRADVKRERYELLIEKIGLASGEAAADFADGLLDRVEVSAANRRWTFFIRRTSVLPARAYSRLVARARETFAPIADVEFVIEYGPETDTDEVIRAHWDNFVEWAASEMVSVNGWLGKAGIEVEDGKLTVILLDEMGLTLARKKRIDEAAARFFERRFGRPCRVKLMAGDAGREEYERFLQEREQADREIAQAIMESAATAAPPEQPVAEKLVFGYEIRDEPVPISNITEEEKRITIQGTVFGLESKELRNGSTLFTFNLTDYTDSITLKVFAKTKDDLAVLKLLKDGMWVRARGRVEYDRFMAEPELVMIPNDLNEVPPPPERTDTAEQKRVEFHLHTTMSTMDAVTPVEAYIKTAAQWGHPAIAISDHANVHCFPEAAKAAKKYNMKVIYGVEANVVDDTVQIVLNPREEPLASAEYVVFDIETTGLSILNSKIIELAGVKMRDGKVVDKFETFVNPHEPIPFNIQQLTNITDDMVKDAPDLEPVLRQFVAFVGDAVLVAHNARFDIGFIQANLKKLGMPELGNPVLDTLEMARLLHPGLKNHRLNTLAEKYRVSLENHHRAVDDAAALGGILYGLIADAKQRGITGLHQLNEHAGKDLSNARPFHCGVYALNAKGKKNLFKLISLSHTQYFNKVACMPKSKLNEMRDGLLILSGCEKGEFFEAVLNKTVEEAEQVAQFYDALEIQPVEFYMHLVDKGLVQSRAEIEQAIRRICEIGERLGKPVIATGNVHYLHPRDKIFREITIHGITGYSPLKEQRKPEAHFRTTDEMLREFAFLGEEKAYEVVVKNTVELAERFETYEMFPDKLFTPVIEGADEEIRKRCYARAKEMYGDPLPEVVEQRLEKELTPIIKYGFSANYLISAALVKKSNEDGYLVGSRGSVGSSVVATFLGISEVNPLPAHYLCRNKDCRHSEWFLDGSVPSGFDLPDKPCPKCGHVMKGDGQDIPFETFLGFKGDKVPDIDLNFSGEYQPHAHNFTKVMFGEKNVFRAGTISTVAEKTAYGFVKKYAEDHGKKWRSAEMNRLAAGCTGVKRSTGQHPGGIIVVPDYIEVEDVTPVQYPADDTTSEWMTTHFDYHAFEANLLKLDILGHDDPTMMRTLQDLTGVDPTTIPMNDPKVMSLFSSTEALGVTPEQIRTPVATYGVPEMGTKFVRQMLEEAKPQTFADLLQISGLSHGTGVWLGNAQELIRNGTCTIKTVIGCRDDIMLYLIYKAGMDAGLAFKITESVRKGKGLTPEWIEEMRRCGVPEWYIESCLKIEYMFPKAHAAAYVISAVRTAYFKLYYPIEFYAAYFTVRAEDFDLELLCQGYDAILRRLIEIEEKGVNATTKEKNSVTMLEMALEMTARGFVFKPIDLYRSDAVKFKIDGNALIPPFAAISGIGESAARSIAAARDEGPFLSIEDFQTRTRVSKTVVEQLAAMGCFRGLPETNQLSLF